MDLSLLTEETSVEDKTQFLSINGYVESRNQVRVKDVDEPISLKQRLWLNRQAPGSRSAKRNCEY